MKLKIEKLIFEGFGLGHSEDGRTIFVRKSVPGDELEVKVIKEKKSFAEAEIQRVIKPSSIRVNPECPYFDKCGGCEHMNISYENQLRLKGEIFNETLARAGLKIKAEPIIAGSDSPLFYRNSIRFFFITENDNSYSSSEARSSRPSSSNYEPSDYEDEHEDEED